MSVKCMTSQTVCVAVEVWCVHVPFLIHMSIIWIYVMNDVCLASQPAKTLTLDIAQKFLNQFLFILAMLIGTIDFYILYHCGLVA